KNRGLRLPFFTCDTSDPDHGRHDERTAKVFAVDPIEIGLPHLPVPEKNHLPKKWRGGRCCPH
ncbi:MAG: hypothetical protein WC076_11340, partial [Terrimicrobiaceae bacterium]